MKTYLSMLFTAMLLMASFALFAQELPIDPALPIDWQKLIGELIANPKALTTAFIGALVVLVLIQGLKSETVGKFFKFIPPQAKLLVLVILGLGYSILVNVFVVKDQDISTVLVGFFSSGGAVVLFNAIKMLFPKFFKIEQA